MSDTRMITILVVNGATLLIVVVLMIRVGAKVFERLVNGMTASVTGLKDEIVGLRRDIREVGTQTAVAIGSLTDRVSRIEGKIEGIAVGRGSEMADHHEVTGVHARVDASGDGNVFVEEQPTPVQTPPKTRSTPPAGVQKVPQPTTYAFGKGPKRG